MNLLQGSCVSRHWRCGAVQIFNVADDEPFTGVVLSFHVADESSAGIVRVASLALWFRARSSRR